MTPNLDPQDADHGSAAVGVADASAAGGAASDDHGDVGAPIESDVLVEDVSIDGMCGVY
jgi:mycofactocin precursor